MLGAALLGALLPTPFATPARAQVPGDARGTCAPDVDFLGFSDVLDKTTFGGFGVSELSGITYDPQREVYYAVADRAGATRAHFFTLDIPVARGALGTPLVRDVTVLQRTSGTPYDGTTLDAEGIAVTHRGEVLVASEGGSAAGEQPEIRAFNSTGAETRSLTVPARFLIGTNNLSLESLALSRNGRSLFTANERPLPAVGDAEADGQTGDRRNRIRILRYEDRGPGGFIPAEQFYYLTEPDRAANDVGVTDLVALSETELLVLERGFVEGQGNTVRVFQVSLRGASDVSEEPTLAAPGLQPLPKRLVFDLANCPPSGATSHQVQPNPLLDNFEGMTLGALLPGGRRALVLVSDDNGAANQVMRLVAVSVPNPGGYWRQLP
jgi:hypothetical protein